MKTKTKLVLSSLVVLSVLSLGFFANANNASAMTCDSATLTGTVITGTPPAHARFEYGTDYNTVANGGGTTTAVQIFNTDGTFPIQQFVSGLSASTTYYVRLMVTNNFGTQPSSINNFTTPSCGGQPIQPTTPPSATISSTASCTAPCDIQIRWTAMNFPNPPGMASILLNGTVGSKNGTDLGWNEPLNGTSGSGTSTQWAKPVGTYNYCIREWSGANLACSTTTVTSAVVIPQTCQDTSATNYGGTLPCVYQPQVNKYVTFSIDKSAYKVGDRWMLSISSNIPNSPVTICSRTPSPSGNSCTLASSLGHTANTNPSGGWSASGVPTNAEIGSWDEYAVINSTNSNDIYFTVSANQVQTCQDQSATNYGGTLPCTYPPQTCQDPSATNYRVSLPCAYPAPTCQDPSALNYRGALPCTYYQPPLTCQDPSATNYRGTPPCVYPPQVCQDSSANNYHGTLPCTYPPQTCQDSSATNYHGTLPCVYNNNNQQPTVSIYANPSSVSYNGSSTITWNSNNATSCSANSGTNGWSGNRSTSGTFYTGNLTYTTDFNITCTNQSGQSAYASVTVYVNNYNNNTCQDSSANNYGGLLPCTYNNYYIQTCQDPSALNYRGTLPCTYYQPILQVCQDPSALNYRGVLPCVYQNVVNNQPTVVVYADQASVAYNGVATVRWITTNAASCTASGGSTGWAGPKSIGPGSFYTGSLTSSETYTLTCTNGFGSATDSATVSVRGRTIINPVTPTSLVLITSSVDRNQPIVPTIDNSRPHPGDEINYTVSYQNIGTGAITGLTLRLDLPPQVDYMFSTPNNPTVSGQTLIFNLGTLKANGQGTVTARVRVREDIPAGTNLDFPAVLSYIDPSGAPQSVTANVSAQVWSEPATVNENTPAQLGANVFGAGFLPTNLFGWLLLLILVLILIFLARYLLNDSFRKKTTTISDGPSGKKTTTTTLE